MEAEGKRVSSWPRTNPFHERDLPGVRRRNDVLVLCGMTVLF